MDGRGRASGSHSARAWISGISLKRVDCSLMTSGRFEISAILDNERSEGQRKPNRSALWANGNSPAQKHRKGQVLRWKEDGGLGLGPGRALIAVRPALLVLIAGW